jgi:predicted dehydrogenase
MSESIRVGVIGLVHDHIWDNLPALKAHPSAQIVAVADSNPELLTRFEEEYNCSATYEEYEDLLQEEELDAVYIYLSNRAGAEAAQLALSMGLHVMIEKPMASTLEEADDMMAAARVSGSRLMINWPLAWWPQLHQAMNLASSGAIGRIWQVKYRAAHAGPAELGCSDFFCSWLFDPEENGGGALMDYCCYGALLARAILGMPARVTGIMGRFCKETITVEDNALLALTYHDAMATAEGSWTQIDKMTAYTTLIYGTEGTLMIEPRSGGKLLKATKDEPDGIEIEVPQLPKELENSATHFIHCLQTGEPFTLLCQDRICRDTQEILEAGSIAAEEGCTVSLPL